MGTNASNGEQKTTTLEHRPRFTARDATFATVLVGPNAVKFTVHENLLIHSSQFFRAALTGKFKEAEEKSVTLGEDDPEIFELFSHWLYTQRMPSTAHGDNPDLVNIYLSAIPLKLIDLYILGDKYGIEKLRSLSITNLAMPDVRAPNINAVKRAFENLAHDSPMCRLVVDRHYYHVDPSRIANLAEWDCVPFLQRLWLRYGAETRRGYLDVCDYHEHTNEQEKQACRTERATFKK